MSDSSKEVRWRGVGRALWSSGIRGSQLVQHENHEMRSSDSRMEQRSGANEKGAILIKSSNDRKLPPLLRPADTAV